MNHSQADRKQRDVLPTKVTDRECYSDYKSWCLPLSSVLRQAALMLDEAGSCMADNHLCSCVKD